MSDTALIRLTNAGYQAPDRWLVEAVSLSVDPGEIVTLIGPNGSGKSTTAKLALGILKPTTGKSYRRKGLKVAYVPQKLAIDWTLPLMSSISCDSLVSHRSTHRLTRFKQQAFNI
jgi:zinc transport system ATP-binding protein